MGRKSNADERRDQITWALFDCLAERGHEKVTIKEIAKKAGLPPGVIHYYFKNKDEIVTSLANAIIQKYSAKLQNSIKKATTPEQQMEYAVDTIINEFVFDLPINQVLYNLIQMTFERKQLRVVIQHLFKKYREQISDVFRSVGVGSDSERLGASLVAVSEGFAIQFMIDPEAFKQEDVKRIIARAIKDRLNIRKLIKE